MPKWERIARGTVALVIWTTAVLLFFHTMGMVVGGYFREFWMPIALFTSAFFVVMVRFLRSFCLQNEPGAAGDRLPNLAIDAKGAYVLNQSNEQPVINNPSQVVIHKAENVTVNNAETHNHVQNGIIGNGTVTFNQHYGNQRSPASVSDEEPVQTVEVVESEDASDIESLHDYAEKLLGRPLAGNTVRNILERAEIESCGNEKRGRAWAKLYPKKEALLAIAKYVSDNK